MSSQATRWYIDTSAAIKLIKTEPESQALEDILDGADPQLVSCYLLETELRRAALRVGIAQQIVTDLLTTIDLYALPISVYKDAGLIPTPGLRSLDALHVAAAKRLQVDLLLTYDSRMAVAANDFGFLTLAP